MRTGVSPSAYYVSQSGYMAIADDYSRECPAIEVDTSLVGSGVAGVLERLAEMKGFPDVITIDNGPEFAGRAMDKWTPAEAFSCSWIHHPTYKQRRDGHQAEHWYTTQERRDPRLISPLSCPTDGVHLIETGSENTKRLYNRLFRNERIEKAAGIINEFKGQIKTTIYDIILDNPWEDEDDTIETLMLLSRFPTPYQLALFSLTFYPETDLYTQAKKDGFVTNDREDVYRKYYLGCEKTYLNSLFLLLDAFAKRGGRIRISPKIMFLLTDRRLRQLKMAWLLYITLKTGFILLWFIPSKKQGPVYLFSKAWNDIRRGDWSRINFRYLIARTPLFGTSNTTVRTKKDIQD
jgi:hypothetical protein